MEILKELMILSTPPPATLLSSDNQIIVNHWNLESYGSKFVNKRFCNSLLTNTSVKHILS